LGQGAVEELGPVSDRLPRLQAVEGFEILRQDPDPVPDLPVPFPDVHAEDAGLPGGWVAQPFEDLDRGRLARAVRPEEGEHLALLDLEGDPIDRLDVRVVLREPANVDYRLGRVIPASSRLPPRPHVKLRLDGR